MNRERADQQGCGRVTRNTKSCHGDHSTADSRIVRNLRRPDAACSTMTVFLRVLGTVFCAGVGHEVGKAGAHARQEADTKPDHKGSNDVDKLILNILQCQPETAQTFFADFGRVVEAFAKGDKDVADGEDTGEHDDHAKTAEEIHIVEGEAGFCINGREAYCRQQDADAGRGEAFEHVALGNRQYHSHGDETQSTVLPRSHGESEVCHCLSEQTADNGTEKGTYEGGRHTDGQRLARQTFFSHRVTVPAGCHGRSRAGDAQQYRPNKCAGATTDPQCQQENNGGGGFHGVGQGHEQHNCHGSRKTGDRAENNTHRGSRNHQKQVQRLD